MINRWLVLFAILSIAFTARAVRIAYPGDFYFDEVYHGFTATQYAKGGQAAHDAYDPWAKCPPGLAFEWTHPPLAKLIMGFFVHIFGEKSWAWRIGSVISGTGAIALTALIGFELFSPTVGLLAAALLSLDGLLLAQSRLAMNDSYFLFFALLSILFYIYAVRSKQNWNRAWVVCGISLGLALACKWTALYLIAILGIDHWYTTLIRQKKTPLPSCYNHVRFRHFDYWNVSSKLHSFFLTRLFMETIHRT